MYINLDDYKNQKEIILAHIKEYGNISTIEGYNKYKIMRVGSVINMLRKEGYNIITKMEHNRDNTKYYARYFLRGDKDEIL
jgi:hypothetical protein